MLELTWFTFAIIDAVAASPTGLVAASLRACEQSAGAFLTSCRTALGNPCAPLLCQAPVFKCRFDK